MQAGEMCVRTAQEKDLQALLGLYAELHGETPPPLGPALLQLWQGMLNDANHHIILVEAKGMLAASCVLVVVPNLTHGQRPYALVENVVTHAPLRRQGYAAAALQKAREIAILNHCYKLMLMTGAKDEGTLAFYEKAGYNRQDKTAFIQWL